jgi:hypothetical protein
MMRRAVRLTLLVLFLAATGLTAYLFWVAEQQTARVSSATRTFDEAARAALDAASELRSAQQAYVAPGQGPDFWFARSHTLQSDLKNRVSALRAQAGSSAAVTALENALGVLQDFEQMDVRAREFARAGQDAAASDLIFSDGLDLTRKVTQQVDAARNAELEAGSELLTSLHRREIFSVGAAAAAALLIVILLVPVRQPAPVPVHDMIAPVPEPELAVGQNSIDALPIEREWRSEAEPEPAPEPPAAEPPAAAPAVAELAAPMPAAPEPSVNLPAVAHLCAELAQLNDTRALPDMLGRAATLLDASGIVLWIADPDGRELAPIVTHGYSPHVVTRLGVIGRDAQNMTAAAFRTSLMQTMASDSLSHGAVAVPLVTPAGCVGVMAAEVGNGGENRESTLAAAGIVAAQLATLVGPPSSRPARAEAG